MDAMTVNRMWRIYEETEIDFAEGGSDEDLFER